MQEVIVSNKMKKFRRERGINQGSLAKKVGIFQSEISDIEIGQRKPNVYLAGRIAKALGKDVSEVFPF